MLFIGIKEEKYIRYISVEYCDSDFEKIVARLRNFYKTSQKVKALIELGNLEWLGPSPYKKYKGDDYISCQAKIRDKSLSAGKHGSSIADTQEAFARQIENNKFGRFHCCFLFEDEQWYLLVGTYKGHIDTIDESMLKKEQLMAGLEVYKYNPDSNYQKLESVKFRAWSQVQDQSNKDNRTYYIFRNNKLISVINPQTTDSIQQAV